ncbi:MAG: class I SAM-dependent DNA methyltransferase [Candidatus Faecisoma sp.]|nr:class I SAM-dependent DNA methyltransferase [Candidatus Faecisoma sp.]
MGNITKNVRDKANLIWSVADKLTGVYKPHEYGDVILPLTVLKRFDSVLSDTKSRVLEASKKFPETFAQRDFILKETSGQNFYNTSKYDFKKLLDDPANIEENFYNYLDGYSKEVTDIVENFDLKRHIQKMANNNILYTVIETFNQKNANLHPNEVSNIEMGYIFEEIIRRFSEAHNEEAGQHYTPREVIELMVNIVFEDQNDLADSSKIKTVYDGACGTGGILSASMEYASKLNNSSKMIVYGQEINDQTYAICKADMLIKGEDSNNIRKGNTLSDDKFPGEKFDFIMMNPPFGREWKSEKNAVETEAKKGVNGRFPAGTPAISDSQLLFLENAVSKMKPEGSKIAIIHNGSALFKGDAGSGESEIRRYVIENDLLDCIIQLPNDLFYNTGIATYIWILNNKKPEHRQGKVQLINANNLYKRMRKNLGNKRNEMTKDHIDEITKIYGNFVENEISKIYDNDFFGYRKVTVLQAKTDENGDKEKNKKGEYIQDKDKGADTETISLQEDIHDYMEREVLPFAPNSYIDNSKTKIGYEISFTKYFYKYQEPRTTKEIMNEILELDKKLDGVLKEISNEKRTD